MNLIIVIIMKINIFVKNDPLPEARPPSIIKGAEQKCIIPEIRGTTCSQSANKITRKK